MSSPPLSSIETERALNLAGDLVEDLQRRLGTLVRVLADRRRDGYPASVRPSFGRGDGDVSDSVAAVVVNPDPVLVEWERFRLEIDLAIASLTAACQVMVTELGPDKVRSQCQNPLGCPDGSMRPASGHLLCWRCYRYRHASGRHRPRYEVVAAAELETVVIG